METAEKIELPASEKGEKGPPAFSPTEPELGTSRAIYLDPLGKELFPTPTVDPLDPLNWPTWRKYICITIVMYMYFLFTYSLLCLPSDLRYITTTTVPSFILLQDQFQATYTEINWTLAIPALGLATGPLFWSSFADIYGRRLIMILGSLFSLIATGCTSLRNISYGGYMAARFFQGFAVAPAATVGLSIINDLSWEHERGFRVGLWVLAIDLGAVFGPLCKFFRPFFL
jgi:MFS family permease